ncbi:TIM-barrel domain-containing protein [Poriferisphaera sp. WC338]|uniref:TIM-barrel domain-containing protein n=1 Tax=Poriferisphaera sp. WC338 TaxID=3425129 RepID=UPI003D813D85
MRTCRQFFFLILAFFSLSLAVSLHAKPLTLTAADAAFEGAPPQIKLTHEKSHTSHWNNLDSVLVWQVQTNKPTTINLSIWQGVPVDLAGSTFTITAADQSYSGKTQGTKGWNDFQPFPAGSFNLPANKIVTIRIQPTTFIKPQIFMDLHQITLTPSNDAELTKYEYVEEFSPLKLSHADVIDRATTAFYPKGLTSDQSNNSIIFTKQLQSNAQLDKPHPLAPTFEQSERSVRATINFPYPVSIYGGGEVTGPLLRNNTAIKFWNTDNYTYIRDTGSRLYQSHPFVLALKPDGSAIGIIADSTYKGSLTITDQVQFTFARKPFRIIVFEAETPQKILQKLADLTGHMPLPPKWSLGYQQCRWGYETEERVKEIAQNLRKRRLPCDVIWMDIDYMDGFRVFTFDNKAFPSPKRLNNYLHARGFKAVWMIDPGIKQDPNYFVYQTGTQEDVWVKTKNDKTFIGDVWPGPCVFPDFTQPKTRTWWADLYKDFMATGIDGVWNDMNEPAVFNGPDFTMPVSNKHKGGTFEDITLPPGTHEIYHNLYGMLMTKASRDGILAANPSKRPFLLTRSNFLGGQRYAATWTGDNASNFDHLKLSIPMTLTLSLSGQPFNGPDLGGFAGKLEPELYAQWVSLGVYFPFARGHAAKDTNDKEPWVFGPEVEAIARDALNRRYRLMPYLYTLFEEASRTGLPVMRPLFMNDPAASYLRDEDRVFTLGSDLLVIPEWADSPALPQGNWLAFEILERKNISKKPEKTSLKETPYKVQTRLRPGAILPLGRVIQNTTQASLKPLMLVINLDENGSATGTLYEDADDGFDYQADDYLRTTYTATRDGNIVTVAVSNTEGNRPRPKRSLVIKVLTDHYNFVTRSGIDGQPLTITLPQ